MATPYSGKSGWASFNTSLTAVNNVTNWSLSVTDSAPGTAHSNSLGWVKSFRGVKAWSATVDILMDSLAVSPPLGVGDAITAMVLYDDETAVGGTGNSYTFTGGVISNASYSCDIASGGLMAVSLSISGSKLIIITHIPAAP